MDKWFLESTKGWVTVMDLFAQASWQRGVTQHDTRTKKQKKQQKHPVSNHFQMFHGIFTYMCHRFKPHVGKHSSPIRAHLGLIKSCGMFHPYDGRSTALCRLRILEKSEIAVSLWDCRTDMEFKLQGFYTWLGGGFRYFFSPLTWVEIIQIFFKWVEITN